MRNFSITLSYRLPGALDPNVEADNAMDALGNECGLTMSWDPARREMILTFGVDADRPEDALTHAIVLVEPYTRGWSFQTAEVDHEETAATG